jgi:hypothetical protein
MSEVPRAQCVEHNPDGMGLWQDVELVRLPTVSEDMQLYPLLNLFQRGHSTVPSFSQVNLARGSDLILVELRLS